MVVREQDIGIFNITMSRYYYSHFIDGKAEAWFTHPVAEPRYYSKPIYL